MIKIFGSPRQYIQGEGALATLGDIARRRKARPLIIVDADVRDMLEAAIVGSFAPLPTMLAFSGEITLPGIEALVTQAKVLLPGPEPILIYGIGGGKALDAAKGVAKRLRADFVSVPTIASNDSPIGRAIAIYDEAHRLARIETVENSPEAVVVDTAVIARAPARFLRAGIGDAIATKFECERAQSDGGSNYFGTPPLLSALALADTCYQTLRRHGVGGMRAAEAHIVTADLEATIEATILMSGIGWESGGVSLAHGVVRGIARTPGTQATLHGEHVAYGLLVQLAIEDRSDAFIRDLIGFYDDIGQTSTLSGLGVATIGSDVIRQIAIWTADGPVGGNVIISASEDEIADAIQRVERLSSDTP